MTLAAAFRGPKGGVLLCSDQEWNDGGVSKRQINKNYRVGLLRQCEVFISGAGHDAPLIRAWEEISKALFDAEASGVDLLIEHRAVIESSLQNVHKQFSKLLKNWPMALLVVVAPRALDRVPMLYRTEAAALVPEQYFYAVGSGKPVADYLADRLFRPAAYQEGPCDPSGLHFARGWGVVHRRGLGANMVFINEGDKAMHFMGPDVVKEMQDGIPSLMDAIQNHWPGKVNFPDWMGS